jgi:hypothetical protein
MSVTGILSSAAFNIGAQLFQNRTQNAQKVKQFQQLGQDLQSGNLSAAQSDFAKLQEMQPKPLTTSTSQSNSGITQDFNQLATDLKTGNTTTAQQDFAKLQQDFQAQATQGRHHHHHDTDSSGSSTAMSQMLGQFDTALQSGNLSAAQQAYASMVQSFQQLNQVGVLPTLSATEDISVNA